MVDKLDSATVLVRSDYYDLLTPRGIDLLFIPIQILDIREH
jgi:hypothetical protein